MTSKGNISKIQVKVKTVNYNEQLTQDEISRIRKRKLNVNMTET